MAEIKLGYMTITCDIVPNGMNFSCWISTAEFYASERAHYPYDYTYIGEFCTWLLHSNMELTPSLITSAGEQADRMCMETEKRNAMRKIANRS